MTRMTKAEVEKMVAETKALAVETLQRDGHHMALMIVEADERIVLGIDGPILATDESKDRLAEQVRELTARTDATGIIFITETWFVRHGNVNYGVDEDGEPGFLRPKNDPHREESLHIRWEFKTSDAGYIAGAWHQVFHHEGEAIILDDTWEPPQGAETGRFVGFLPRD